jgi:hypothetical protein
MTPKIIHVFVYSTDGKVIGDSLLGSRVKPLIESTIIRKGQYHVSKVVLDRDSDGNGLRKRWIGKARKSNLKTKIKQREVPNDKS